MDKRVVLQLLFRTDQDKTVRISIRNPKQPVDATAVTNALDQVVQHSAVFAFSQGKIVAKAGANLVETDTTAVV
ncbi:DUF2922 domain-containing protein [Alicyclobacillus shizuokensis]|uniref:DUF2922 domain-containing protein n=1 Tax=Alicyclobacillus shizuokensis TaxID=392014 RepID=UPI0008370BC3|nr:DUF2922 domain-containing protein [Alicyclobacillus shizuokensis]MCL6626351.1 DUF2922 domain-containing protein [Alicyclobacillus shizuokensis]